MSQQFKKGDKVEWSSGSGKSTGTVQKRVTDSTTVDGQSVAASEEDPRYLVENDNTGNVSGHRPDALSKAGSSDSSSSDGSSSGSESDSTESDSTESSDRSERDDKTQEFNEAVNMTAKQIEDWLKTEESKSVGQKDSDGNIKGRESGKHIVKILNKKKSNYTEEDFERMQKVVAYVHRHLAQKPSSDIENSNWRYSLMNWGHDPCKS